MNIAYPLDLRYTAGILGKDNNYDAHTFCISTTQPGDSAIGGMRKSLCVSRHGAADQQRTTTDDAHAFTNSHIDTWIFSPTARVSGQRLRLWPARAALHHHRTQWRAAGGRRGVRLDHRLP